MYYVMHNNDRWDIQRARTLREHHELLRKYNMKGGGGEKVPEKRESDTSLSSFIPELRESEYLYCRSLFVHVV